MSSTKYGMCEHHYLNRNCPYCLINTLKAKIASLEFRLADETNSRHEAEAEIVHLKARVRQLQRRRREETERLETATHEGEQ